MSNFPLYRQNASRWSEEHFEGDQKNAAFEGYCAGSEAQIEKDIEVFVLFFTDKKLRHLKKLLNSCNKPTINDIVDEIHSEIRNAIITENNL